MKLKTLLCLIIAMACLICIVMEADGLTKEKRAILIYASRYGSTAQTSEWIAEGMKGLPRVVSTKEAGDLTSFDVVILGSPIYMEKLHVDMQTFLDARKEELKGKEVIIFVVCSTPPPEAQKYLDMFASEGGVTPVLMKAFGGWIKKDLLSPQDYKLLENYFKNINQPFEDSDQTDKILCLQFGREILERISTKEKQEQILAIKNAHIYPVTSSEIPSGVLLVKGNRIMAVGADVSIPAEARVIDAQGKHVIPGIIESHSHMGQKLLWKGPVTGSDNNELSEPVNAHCRAIDGLDTSDVAFGTALEGGITSMNIITGSRSPNSGQAVVVKLRGGTAEEMFLAHGGMKFAIRATERRRNFPKNIEEVGTLLRYQLKAAQDYMKAWEQYRSGEITEAPKRDLKLEALSKVLTREWIVGVHSSTEKLMRIPVELKKEFNLDLYIIHGFGVEDLAEELAELGIPVSFGPVFSGSNREHPWLEGPVKFVRLGGKLSFQEDHPDGPQYYLRHSAALFVRKGLSKEDALRALTINPAELLRLKERIGSLEPGKDADFLILSGPPLEWESLVEKVFVEGKEVYNRNTRYNVFK
ncbi:MAG: amidohydrolase family protein [Candidatus Aminicenantes bacterium]|nr:MAG: amidohydrolase family protein [Candidatus Aminicenantes bacterium]